ncbi:MAG: hypothetical protein Q8P20_05600 [bacterium]|nr:hypothetical protein [bacterium]
MSTKIKILLSAPTILGLFYMLTFWFPSEFIWVFPSMKSYHIQMLTFQALTIIQIVVLLRRLWSFKSLAMNKKKKWTWIIIIFNVISSQIYIWRKDKEFEEINKNTVPNNA